MIEIAGGILLAVLILAFLPGILAGLFYVVVVVATVAIMGGAAWGIWTGFHTLEGIVALLMIFGLYLIRVAFGMRGEMKAKADLENPH